MSEEIVKMIVLGGLFITSFVITFIVAKWSER